MFDTLPKQVSHLCMFVCMRYICTRTFDHSGLVLSGSWDESVGAWDVRTKNICHRLNIGAKVFAMCVTPSEGPYGKLVVADSAKRLHIFDYRKFEKAEEVRE